MSSRALIPNLNGLEAATVYTTAYEYLRAGGDFYAVFHLRSGHAAFVIGDASGKGREASARDAEVRFLPRPTPCRMSRKNRFRDYACLIMGRMRDRCAGESVGGQVGFERKVVTYFAQSGMDAAEMRYILTSV